MRNEKLTLIVAIPLLLNLQAVMAEYLPEPTDCKYVKEEEKCDCYRAHEEYYKNKMNQGYKLKDEEELDWKRKYYRDKARQCR